MTTKTSEIYQTISDLSEIFEATYAKGNATDIAEFYTENGMLLPAGFDRVQGKEDIQGFWQAAIDMGIKNIKIDIIEVECHDDTVIEMSNYTLSSDNDQVLDQGKGIVIWKNVDGAWKLHRDIWNSSLTQQ